MTDAMASIVVLHIGAHLGGGIGRVLSRIAQHRRSFGSWVEEIFVCFEKPQNRLHADRIIESGARLVVAPSSAELAELTAAADVIQLEWWHHPRLAGWMAEQAELRARLVVWAHVSGLHYPAIPIAFTHLPHAFLLTSSASLHALSNDPTPRRNILEVISSTGGFDDFPFPEPKTRNGDLRFGYLGSLNPAKMHPDMASFIAGIDRPGFTVNFYGDPSVNPAMQLIASGSSQIRLHGHTDQPDQALQGLDVLLYLLNPTHYGTTENALLEAMACGVVPIVLNNTVESSIVQHGETGLIVDSPRSFAEAVAYLSDHPDVQRRLSAACSDAIRKRYSVPKTVHELDQVYEAVMAKPKTQFDFQAVFGTTPADWLLSCAGDYTWCFDPDEEEAWRTDRRLQCFLYERSKSSAFHFQAHFPNDARLSRWAAMLERDLAHRP